MALKNLTRRKLRATLTILGVVIGTTSIVVMLSIGIGLNDMFNKQFEEMGSLNTIEVHPSRGDDDKRPEITLEQMSQILALPNVKAITPIFEEYNTQKMFEDYEMYASIYAIKPSTMKLFDFEAKKGRIITPDDELQVVVGSKVWEQMYDSSSDDWERPEEEIDLLGEEIEATIYNYSQDGKEDNDEFTFEVVGILKDAGYPKDYSIFINIDYYQPFINELREASGEEIDEDAGYEQAWVYVNDMENVQEVIDQIEQYGVRARSDLEYIEQAKKQMAIIQAVLGGLGGISLLVAAIGITNTMIMAIYERTKEIGVMKVIGANIKDIKRLFLIEAALIGFWGGAIGLLFSFGLSLIVNQFAGSFIGYGMEEGAKLSLIPMWLVGASMAFSTLIGIVSGYLPARRAMKLSALQAIRTQ